MMPIVSDTMAIGGFQVVNAGAEPAARWVLAQIGRRCRSALFFANTNFVTRCRHMAGRIQRHPVVIFNDGIGLDLAALMLHRQRFETNLNGTDFIPYLFQRSTRPLNLFLLGSHPDVLHKAAAFVRRVLGQQVVDVCDGYESLGRCDELVDRINRARPDILLVALGNPSQEEWILEHLDRLDIGLAIGVGGLFDFWSGAKPRAPVALRRLHMEWLFRLCVEPRRLARRYTLEVMHFLMHCLREKGRTQDSMFPQSREAR